MGVVGFFFPDVMGIEKDQRRKISMSQQNLPDFDSLWDYSNPDQTEIKFREILSQIPANEPSHLELLTQIARAQGLQRKFDEAHQTLDQVEKTLGENPSRAKIRYLLERGRVFNSSGHADDARPFFEQALDLAKQLGEDFYAVDAIHMLAIIAAPASALTLNLECHSTGKIIGTGKSAQLAWLVVQQYGLGLSRHG